MPSAATPHEGVLLCCANREGRGRFGCGARAHRRPLSHTALHERSTLRLATPRPAHCGRGGGAASPAWWVCGSVVSPDGAAARRGVRRTDVEGRARARALEGGRRTTLRWLSSARDGAGLSRFCSQSPAKGYAPFSRTASCRVRPRWRCGVGGVGLWRLFSGVFLFRRRSRRSRTRSRSTRRGCTLSWASRTSCGCLTC